jgi:NAD+ diphosphatase
MLGYFCEYESGEIKIEEAELEDAKWFKVDDLPNVPPKLSISGQLISSYLEDRSKL